jgi:hypothetical protein
LPWKSVYSLTSTDISGRLGRSSRQAGPTYELASRLHCLQNSLLYNMTGDMLLSLFWVKLDSSSGYFRMRKYSVEIAGISENSAHLIRTLSDTRLFCFAFSTYPSLIKLFKWNTEWKF